MKEFIQTTNPYLNGNELKYLTGCIIEVEACGGRFLNKFKSKIVDYSDMEYRVCTSNGTVATLLALHSIGPVTYHLVKPILIDTLRIIGG